MGIAGNHFHNFNLVTVHLIVQHLIRTNFTKLDQAVSADNNEFFILRMVPMLTFGNSRFRDIHRELPTIRSTNNFRKTPRESTFILRG